MDQPTASAEVSVHRATTGTGVPAAAGHKPHYPILDGLRGVAALLVVVFHLFEAYYPDYAKHPIHHGYLAVDFFFLLSGFVVGYAYDDRWGKMTVREFFTIRLVRLQPLVVLGVLLGLVGFWLDPFSPKELATAGKVAGALLLSLLVLPGPDIRGWNETHPLNGPSWSLLQEYIANVVYALWGRRMTKTVLWIVVIASAAALVATAVNRPNIGTGWSYETFWIAIVRMAFPFFAGLLLFRTGRRIRIPFAFPLCAAALAVLFVLPAFRYNGLYEAAAIIIAFPLIVAAGAGSAIAGRWGRICKFCGDISYPIYITHYPAIYIYSAWVYIKKPAPAQIVLVAAGLFVFFVVLAWASLKWFDEPVRAWLKKKWLDKKAPAANP